MNNLIDYKHISSLDTRLRSQKIDTIVIHYFDDNFDLLQIGELEDSLSLSLNTNYGIDSHGKIGLYVEEQNIPDTVFDITLNERSFTIGIATTPWPEHHITRAAFKTLEKLLLYACKKYNMGELRWLNNPSCVHASYMQNVLLTSWFNQDMRPHLDLIEELYKITKDVNQILGNPPKESRYMNHLPTITNLELFSVRFGSYTHKREAEIKREKLARKGIITMVIQSNSLYHVQTANYTSRESAMQLQSIAQNMGESSDIIDKNGNTIPPEDPEIKIGSQVKIEANAKNYNGDPLRFSDYYKIYTVTSLAGNRAVVSFNNIAAATLNTKDLILI